MNRFAILLITLSLLAACRENESDCVEIPTPVSGQLLFVGTDTEQTIYRLDSLGDVTICNPDVLTIDDYTYYEVQVDTAVFWPCQDCVEILEWSGPGCDFQFEWYASETPLLNTTWSFDRFINATDTMLAPCTLLYEGAFLNNDAAAFNLGNSFSVDISIMENQVFFEGVTLMTLAFVDGYPGKVENLFQQSMFNDEVFDIELTGNRLKLSQEDKKQFIFYAK